MTAQEDGAEIAVVLKRVLAGRPLSAVPDGEIAAALRDFESRRSARCGKLIAEGRVIGKRRIFPKSFLVCLSPATSFRESLLSHGDARAGLGG